MCRARFEHDDAAESEVLCGGNPRADPDIGPAGDASHPNRDTQPLNLDERHHSPSSFLTWRIPAWVDFSYSTRQYLPLYPPPRHPNPFRTQSQEFTRLHSASPDRPQAGQEGPPKSHFSESTWRGTSFHEVQGASNQPIDGSLDPVVDHPPPIPWDDQTTVDLPYDNPYYTRALDNVLWLPRDPCGIVDLDDTIDLKVSLTVEATAGKLGTWLGLQELDPLEGRLENETHSPERYSVRSNVSPIDGNEDITLPAPIAERTPSEGDSSQHRVSPKRPPFHRPRTSGSERVGTSRPGRGRRRLTISSENAVPLALHSFSGRTRRPPEVVRPSCSMPSLQIPQPTHGVESKFPVHPGLRVHGEVVSSLGDESSVLSIPASRSTRVSTREAIFHEVLAEERAALIDRIEDEHAETQKTTTTKSWLTSWMFTKPQ